VCYFTFACGEAKEVGMWLNTNSIGLCTLAFLLCIMPCTQKKGCHKFRMIVFLIAGNFGILPMVYARYYEPSAEVMLLDNTFLIIGGGCYIVGVLIYGFHFPEICSPGKYDICGASH